MVAPVADGGEAAVPARADPTLLKALTRAFRYQRMLDTGKYTTIGEMAAGERLDRGYLSRLLQLTLLAPDIVEAILDGRQAEGVTLPRLLEPLTPVWNAQGIALDAHD